MPKYSQVLNMPKFWILRSFEYGMVLFIRACHSFVNMPEYVLIDFWNILDSKYGGGGGGGGGRLFKKLDFSQTFCFS